MDKTSREVDISSGLRRDFQQVVSWAAPEAREEFIQSLMATDKGIAEKIQASEEAFVPNEL